MEQIFLKQDSSMKSALLLAVSLVISIFICMIGNFALHSPYLGIVYQPEFSICRSRIHISWLALLVLAHTLRLAFESVLRLRSRINPVLCSTGRRGKILVSKYSLFWSQSTPYSGSKVLPILLFVVVLL